VLWHHACERSELGATKIPRGFLYLRALFIRVTHEIALLLDVRMAAISANLYEHYVPSKAAALVGVITFGILTEAQLYMTITCRKWFGFAMVIGGSCMSFPCVVQHPQVWHQLWADFNMPSQSKPWVLQRELTPVTIYLKLVCTQFRSSSFSSHRLSSQLQYICFLAV
jgi:hypothetical protein